MAWFRCATPSVIFLTDSRIACGHQVISYNSCRNRHPVEMTSRGRTLLKSVLTELHRSDRGLAYCRLRSIRVFDRAMQFGPTPTASPSVRNLVRPGVASRGRLSKDTRLHGVLAYARANGASSRHPNQSALSSCNAGSRRSSLPQSEHRSTGRCASG
jgi:hypothetical protein